jgi:hypothetical protein
VEKQKMTTDREALVGLLREALYSLGCGCGESGLCHRCDPLYYRIEAALTAQCGEQTADTVSVPASKRVLRIVCQDYSVFYSQEWSSRLVAAIERQADKRHGGVRSMELIEHDKEVKEANFQRQRAEKAEAALRVQTNQIGVACLKHDLIHQLTCGICHREAEAELSRYREKYGELE